MLQVYGGCPPLTERPVVNTTPIVASASSVEPSGMSRIVGFGCVTARRNRASSGVPPAFTVMTTVNEPAVSGVPESTPVLDKLRPGGKALFEVNVAVPPPDVKKLKLYGCPTTPGGRTWA